MSIPALDEWPEASQERQFLNSSEDKVAFPLQKS
jgi:hypothetical protein